MSEASDEEVRYQAVLALDVADPGTVDGLISALRDDSWRVRKAAAARVRELHHPQEAIPHLMALLRRRGDASARNSAAEALAGLGRVALPALERLLEDEDPDQRKFAAEILGQTALSQAEPALVVALNDADPNVRVASAEALGHLAADAGARALQRLLAHDDPLLRLSALNALAALKRPPPLPTLAPLLDRPLLQRAAFRLLGHIPGIPAVGLAAKGLLSDSVKAREAALAALGNLWTDWAPSRRAELDAAAKPWIRRLADTRLVETALASEDAEVRRGGIVLAGLLKEAQPIATVAAAAAEEEQADVVAWALRRAGPAAGRELVLRLPSLGRVARGIAAEALIDLADPSWLEPLERLLGSGEDDLELFALRALARTRSLGAVRIAATRLMDPHLGAAAAKSLVSLGSAFKDAVLATLEQAIGERAVPAMVRAIATVGRARALPVLRRALKDPEAHVRAAAAEAAAEAGGEERDELIRAALADEAPVVRAAALRSLGRTGDPPPELLKIGLADPDADVRRAAIEAVGEAMAVEVAPSLEALAVAPDGLTAAEAVRALGRMGRLGEALLHRVAEHKDPEVLKEALRAAAALPGGVPVALAALDHPAWDVRAEAARILAGSGGSDCLDAVRSALERELDPVVREALAESAQRLSER